MNPVLPDQLPTQGRQGPQAAVPRTPVAKPPGRSPFHLAVVGLTRLSVSNPKTTIALALIAAVAALFLAAQRLGFHTNRADLVNTESGYGRLYQDYLDEFGEGDDAVIVVESQRPEDLPPVLDDLADALAQYPQYYHSVLHRVDLAPLSPKGLHYLPAEQLAQAEELLQSVDGIFDNQWHAVGITPLVQGLSQTISELPAGSPRRVQAEGRLRRLCQAMREALQDRPVSQFWNGSDHAGSPPESSLEPFQAQYLLSDDRRLGFVLSRLAVEESSFTGGTQAVDLIRQIIAEASLRHPNVRIGLTGLPILENDEMRASQASMTLASAVSMAAVALLFVATLGGLRHALLANLVLCIGIAWSFGFITLSVGHLNIFSMSFAVTLIGIGIDYGVHYVARYLRERQNHATVAEALLATSEHVSPAIITGAVTTAVAFFAAAFTSFVGVAELGIIAGGGILLCAAAELFVLPAAICLVDGRPRFAEMPNPVRVDHWFAPLVARPRRVLGIALCVCLLCVLGTGHLRFDHNLLNLQPVGLESASLERDLLAAHNQSVWYALAMANTRQEALDRKAAFLELPSVARVEEIVSLLPLGHEGTRAAVGRIHARLADIPRKPPTLPLDPPEELLSQLTQARGLLSQVDASPECLIELTRTETLLSELPPEASYPKLFGLQARLAHELLATLTAMQGASDPVAPTAADLPPEMAARFIGKSGRHLLRVYGRGSIWDMAALQQFVSETRQVDPRITGNPIQAFEASHEMKNSYELAGCYALVVIVLVLYLDYRSLWHTLLALVPLALGVGMMFGLQGWLDLPLNPANMIGLPLILGIGVDYGVHIVHEYRESSGRYQVSASLAAAVMLDVLTTIVGFGSLILASHRGLQSMGRSMTLGLTCCVFASLVILPAVLSMLPKKQGTPPAEMPKLTEEPSLTEGPQPPLADNLESPEEATSADRAGPRLAEKLVA